MQASCNLILGTVHYPKKKTQAHFFVTEIPILNPGEPLNKTDQNRENALYLDLSFLDQSYCFIYA